MILKNSVKCLGIIIILMFTAIYCSNTLNISNDELNDSYNSNSQNNIANNKQSPLISASSQEWVRTWGVPNSDDICTGTDVYNKTGDVYLVGLNQSGFTDKILFIKYNSSGELEWEKQFIFGTSSSKAHDVVIDQNTGEIYILAEAYFSGKRDDIVVAKYYNNGTHIWNTTWGYDYYDWAGGISYDNNGNLYVSGTILDSPTNKIFLVKFDKDTGDQIWNATWDTPFDDWGYNVACGPSGEIYITGYREINANNHDMVLISYDENKVQNWNTTWGVISYNESGNAVDVDSQGNIYVTGTSEEYPYDDWFMFLCKFNSSGILNWSKSYGGWSNTTQGRDLYIDSNDNAFVGIAGYAPDYGNALILRGYNSTGELIFQSYWNDAETDLWTFAISGYDSNIYLIGGVKESPVYPTDWDMIIVKNPSQDFPNGEDPDNGGSSNGGGDNSDDDNENINNESLILYTVIIISVCSLVATYLYHYKNKNLKKKISRKLRLQESGRNIDSFQNIKEILLNLTDKKLLHNIFDIDRIDDKNDMFNNLDLTTISIEFLEKLNSIEVDKKEKIEFLKEMLMFSPFERNEILDNIINRFKSYFGGE